MLYEYVRGRRGIGRGWWLGEKTTGRIPTGQWARAATVCVFIVLRVSRLIASTSITAPVALGPISGKNHLELKTAMSMHATSFPAF
jgi:hypothetical protein